MPQVINSAELFRRMASSTPPHLIDVRLEDDFTAEHLLGASNNCVFEVAFLSRMQEKLLDLNAPICLYGADEKSHEARMAVEKLTRAKFTQILELREGLAGWKAAGFEVKLGSPVSDPFPVDGSYPIDLNESRVEWTGRNLINKHWGTIGVKSGEIRITDGIFSGGEFVLDMTNILCTDLADTDLHDVLITHLKSDDFFDVENYPEARFAIQAVEMLYDAPGAINVQLTGDLTLRGHVKSITLNASAGLTEEGKPAAQASCSIDRTHWNIIYGSGKFFTRLAGHVVNDEIDLQLRLLTK